MQVQERKIKHLRWLSGYNKEKHQLILSNYQIKRSWKENK